MEEKKEVLKYIKQMTSIPNDFIDDLFKFYDDNTLQTDFVIDLDVVTKWFDTSKSALISTLRESKYLKENIDYKFFPDIKNPKKKVARANNYKHFRLTPDCFKQLAMASRAKKSHLVRAYFIEIENLFIKYRKQTLMGIEMEVQQMAKNQKPLNAEPQAGYVYVVRASEKKDSIYKIGRTKDLHARLRSHQSALADDLSVEYIYRTNNIEAVEKCTHAWLKEYQYRKFKEVFQINLDIIKKIISKCGAIEKTFLKLENKMKVNKEHKGGMYMITVKD